MPIKPENKARYPADWQTIRERILERAEHKCELCFLRNGASIHRGVSGEPVFTHEGSALRMVRIVLTIAHINQQPEDNRDANLLALCQRCHNRIDLPYRMQNAATTRETRNS